MQFHTPGLLWFLLLGLIPIIIHLFRFRRYRRVEFTRVDLLKQITVKTGLGNKIRKLILMTLRILGILSLVFAFASPFIPERRTDVQTQKNKLIVFLDNSLSMSGDGVEGPVFEAAKNRARALVNDFTNEFSFYLITQTQNQDFSQAMDKDEILGEIDKLSLSNSAITEKDIFSAIASISDKSSISVYISDFRKGFLKNLPENFNVNGAFYWLGVPANHNENVSIDSAWFFSPQLLPGHTLQLNVKLTNYGKENVKDVSLRLVENEQAKGVVNTDIEAGRSKVVEIPFSAGDEGWKSTRLELPGDEFHFDDIYYLTYIVQKGSKGLVLSDNGGSPYLKALFSQNSGFDVKFISPLQIVFDQLNTTDFVICEGLSNVGSGLSEELSKFVNNGGNLIIFPTSDPSQNSANNILGKLRAGVFSNIIKQDISAEIWDLKDPLMQGVFQNTPQNVDLPQFYSYYSMLPTSRQIVFWKLKNGSPLATKTKRGSGVIYTVAVPLDKSFSNLVMHPFFVPFMLRIASYKEAESNLAYETGTDAMLSLKGVKPTKDEVWKLKNNDTESIPEVVMRDNNAYLVTHGSITEPGIYSLYNSENVEDYRIAFNLHRTESQSAVESLDDLKNTAEKFGVKVSFEKPEFVANEIKRAGEGTPLWKFFIFAAFLFLVSEMILIRVWKV
ncbi:MAG: BatA domain-containing protein [Bacteroidetes bacterium]|nr:BatA domain-containing protein [Bacteroidota bacterium]